MVGLDQGEFDLILGIDLVLGLCFGLGFFFFFWWLRVEFVGGGGGYGCG